MRRIQFFQLSRAMQERLMSSAKGSAPPAPILRRRGATRAHLVYGAVAGVALFVLLGVVFAGYGSLGKSAAVQPYSVLALYAALLFAVPFGVLRAVGLVLEAKALPFPPGVYVFPMCLVDARTKSMRVAPMSDLVKVEPATKDEPFRLTYKGMGTFEFPTSGGDTAEQLKFQFEVAQEQAKHAKETGDEAELVTLDPFYEPKRFVSPIGPQEPLVERVPQWVKLGWLVAAGAALLMTPAAYFLRNGKSDDATLRRAQEDGSPAAFRAYLEFGRRHKDDVERVLLPRAELEVAKREGTVEAVQQFIAEHPDSKIAGEASAALRDAYAAELAKAKAKTTVAALDEFSRKYPQHGFDGELAAARHALFAQALAKLKKSAPGLDDAGGAFLDALFASLEKTGGRVVVVFRREISPNLDRADKLIGAAPTNKTLGARQVTKYFSDAPNPKEIEVVRALGQTLGKVVPADVMRFEQGPPAGDLGDDAIAAQTKAPVLVVRYRIGWLGVAFSSNALKRAFAGVHVTGDAALYVPASARAVRAKLEIPPPRGLLLRYESEGHPGFATSPPADDAEPEPAIYATQEMRALDLVTGALERMIAPPAK